MLDAGTSMWQHVTICSYRRVISILLLLSKYVESSVIYFYRVLKIYDFIVTHLYQTCKILTYEGVFFYFIVLIILLLSALSAYIIFISLVLLLW